jgi:hypothetical protein
VSGFVGAGQFVNGVNDLIDAAFEYHNALSGHPGAVNAMQTGFEGVAQLVGLRPAYGDVLYQLQATGFSLAGVFTPKPLVVADTEITGINTYKSLFGYTVPRINNPIVIPGVSAVTGPIQPPLSTIVVLGPPGYHGYELVLSGYQAVNDGK